MAPSLEPVLAAVQPGRVVSLELTPEQRRALRNVDGQIALDVLRYTLGARAAIGAPDRFPLSEHAFQAVARKLGHGVAQKRSRALKRRLIDAGVIDPSGSYRQRYKDQETRSGYRVTLYRLAAGVLRFAKSHLPVGKRTSVKRPKRLRWWQHPLFGDYKGLPPPGIPRARLRRMWSRTSYSSPRVTGQTYPIAALVKARPTQFRLAVL